MRGADLDDNDYLDFFKTWTKQITNNEVTIPLEEKPVFIEEETPDEISVTISKPKDGHLHVFDREITSIARNTIIIGGITIEVDAYSKEGIGKVEFYINGVLRYSDYEEPYGWLWAETFLVGMS